MHTALDLSKYITKKCADDDYPITNLQLQKILFYIQREFLRKFGKPAFSDAIEAWKYGPVIPDIYYYFCEYGGTPIYEKKMDDYSLPNDSERFVVDTIIEEKRGMRPWALVKETHKEDGAWDQIYKTGNCPKIIPNELIEKAG